MALLIIGIALSIVLVAALLCGVISQMSNPTGNFYWGEFGAIAGASFVILASIVLVIAGLAGGIVALLNA